MKLGLDSRNLFYILADLKQFARGNEFIRKEESHSVVLKCLAPASYPDRQIQWSKIDPQNRSLRKPLPQSPHYTVSANGDLHFSYVKTRDSGDYVCTVTNNIINRHVVRTVVLTVYPGEYELGLSVSFCHTHAHEGGLGCHKDKIYRLKIQADKQKSYFS